MIEEKITDLLDVLFETEDFSDCFLIEVKLHANKKLEVFVDSDEGITFRGCQRISRYLEQHLDEEGWLGEKYTLEVSSPGIGRPLKLQRQYPKNIGRKVEISMTDGPVKTGTLVEVHEDGLVIEEKVVLKEGKRKKREVVKTSIPFEAIKQTVVKVSF